MMRKKISWGIAFAIVAILVVTAALPVFAQTSGTLGKGGTQSPNCATGQVCLENPLKFTSVEKFVEGLLRAVVMIALPIISVFIIYAGFKYIAARGNPGKIGEAHNNFKYVLIGATLILSAWVLATLIGGTVSQLLR